MRYEPSLDGLRALAVTAVVLFHFSGRIIPGGWAGVDIFFVLSGYLITTIIAEEERRSGKVNLIKFYARRALRLLPAFFVLLLAEVARSYLFLAGAEQRSSLISVSVSALYFMNWNRAFDLLPQGVLGHTWSLAMEEQFYLVWPTVFVLAGRIRKAYLAAAILFLVTMWRFYLCFFAGADPERTYNGFDSHSDGLLIGCLLALGNPHRFVQTAARYAVIPAIAMLCIFLLLPHRTIFTQTFGLTLSAAISAWLILGAMGEGWLKHWLTRPWMVFTGRISYAWYLWHYPVILWSREIFPQTGAAKYLAMFVAAAAGYLAAAASYRWIETPFLNLKARFSGHGARPDIRGKTREAEGKLMPALPKRNTPD